MATLAFKGLTFISFEGKIIKTNLPRFRQPKLSYYENLQSWAEYYWPSFPPQNSTDLEKISEAFSSCESFCSQRSYSKSTIGNTRVMCAVCWKVTIKVPERRQDVVLVALSLLLKGFYTLFWSFHCWLWKSKYRLGWDTFKTQLTVTVEQCPTLQLSLTLGSWDLSLVSLVDPSLEYLLPKDLMDSIFQLPSCLVA